jgi:hypothetical protein
MQTARRAFLSGMPLLLWAACGTAMVAQERPSLTLRLGGESITLQASQSESFVQLRTATPLVNTETVRQRLLSQLREKLGSRLVSAQANPSMSIPSSSRFPGGEVVRHTSDVSASRQSALATPDGIPFPVYEYNGRRVIFTDTISVGLRTAVSDATVSRLKETSRAIDAWKAATPGIVRLRFARGATYDIEKQLAAISALDDVEWAEPEFLSQLRPSGSVALDDFLRARWFLKTVGMPLAWDLAAHHNGPRASILVAVLDDGVDKQHPDLQSLIVGGSDFVIPIPPAVPTQGSPGPSSHDAHGTACAGMVAAVAGPTSGSASPMIQVLPIRVYHRVLDEMAFVSNTLLADAVTFAVGAGAKVISCSWGQLFGWGEMDLAIENAVKQDRLVVAAAGNDSAIRVDYPASHPKVVAVGASDHDDTLWSYSSHKPGGVVDLVAPSGRLEHKGDIFTTDIRGVYGTNRAASPDGDYDPTFGGTSAAAPLVAGVAAWLWSFDSKRSAQSIRRLLEESALPLDGTSRPHSKWGYGRINPAKAFQLLTAVAPTSGPVPSPSSPTPAAASPAPASAHAPTDETPISFKARGDTVRLVPDDSFMAVFLDAGPKGRPLHDRFAAAMQKKAVPAWPTIADGKEIWVLPRASMSTAEIAAFPSDGASALMFQPVYRAVEDSKTLVVLTGRITALPKNAEATKNLKEQFGKTASIQEKANGLLLFDPDNPAKMKALLDSMNRSDSIQWAEPNFIQTVRK